MQLTSPKKDEDAKINAVCEFLVEQGEFHSRFQVSLPKWTSTIAVNEKVIPDSMYEILSSVVLLIIELNELIRFDTSYKESTALSNLINLDISKFHGLSTYDLSEENFNSLYTELSAA